MSLCQAAKDKNYAKAKKLIDGGTNVNETDSRGWTPLHIAADLAQLEICRALLNKGAKTDPYTKKKNTPLHLAAYRGNYDVCDLLLRYGADKNAKDSDGGTPMDDARNKGHTDLLSMMKNFDIKVKPKSQKGDLVAAAKDKKLSEVKRLLSIGHDVDERDTAGWTPLHHAANGNQTDMCRALLEAGAGPNFNTNKKNTPMHLAAYRGYAGPVKALLEHGGDMDAPDKDGGTPMDDAKNMKMTAVITLFNDWKKKHSAPPPTAPSAPVTVKPPATQAQAVAEGKYHAFFTHDWGMDQNGRDNHKRVVAIAKACQARGISVWIDEDEMTGNVVEQMCRGIDNSAIVVVFVTKRYMDKVSGYNDDNCKKEFSYACRKKGTRRLVPVVMEEKMNNTNDWDGAVGMELGGELYVSMWDDNIDKGAERICAEVTKRM